MDAIRKILALLMLVFAGTCVVAWAVWFNPDAFGMIPLPIAADDFPMGPMTGPLVVGVASFLVAFIVYPSSRDRGRD